jgi:uncharacterized protein (DUF1800 family)
MFFRARIKRWYMISVVGLLSLLSACGNQQDTTSESVQFALSVNTDRVTTPLRNQNTNNKASAKAAETTVLEQDANHTNHFVLSISSALNTEARVDYTTVDGTATQGTDYIRTAGTAIIPAGDTQVLIPVEIIGDTIAESNETFTLQISNPVGAAFPANTAQLSATHTIVNDDGITDAFATTNSTARFLTQATFGPTPSDISNLTGTAAADWVVAEFNKTETLHLPLVENYLAAVSANSTVEENEFIPHTPSYAFWKNAMSASDQLRQRMAFALSEIFVVSSFGENELYEIPKGLAYYQDLMVKHAFGNYRDLLEAVTYSPAMGYYLTYMGNEKSDPDTGRVPDENYAREILQLFSIGLVMLNKDGSTITDANGKVIETYTNKDITGLAKVFTGLDLDNSKIVTDADYYEIWHQAMIILEEDHSSAEKTFLGTTIPANTTAAESIRLALDHIANHQNVAPFISRQLIQRFVTSHPTAAYIKRVATVFEQGSYTLPNGTTIGEAKRGDLKATLAAILFDEEARSDSSRAQASFGKVREPIIRLTNWVRAFEVGTITPELTDILNNTESADTLNQHPYRSLSVFNFYRPGYVPPSTLSGVANLTIPELQIVNTNTIPSYINFMTTFIYNEMEDTDTQAQTDFFQMNNVNLDASQADKSFISAYTTEKTLAADPVALVDHLNNLLTYGELSNNTREQIINVISDYAVDDSVDEITKTENINQRIYLAILMIMSSPDYLIQR